MLLESCDCAGGTPCVCGVALPTQCKCSPLGCACNGFSVGEDDSMGTRGTRNLPFTPAVNGGCDEANLEKCVLGVLGGSVSRSLGAVVDGGRVLVMLSVFPGCERDPRRARGLLTPQEAIDSHRAVIIARAGGTNTTGSVISQQGEDDLDGGRRLHQRECASFGHRPRGNVANSAAAVSTATSARMDTCAPVVEAPFWIKIASAGQFPPPPALVAVAAFVWFGGLDACDKPLSWRALHGLLVAWIGMHEAKFLALARPSRSSRAAVPRKKNGSLAWATPAGSVTKDLIRLVLHAVYDPAAERLRYFLRLCTGIADALSLPPPPPLRDGHCESEMFEGCVRVGSILLDHLVTNLHCKK